MTVELSGVTIRYGDVTAVENFNLEIADGELVVLLGPSGCGKTSVMRSIVGLERPASGRITIDGEVVYDAHAGIELPIHRRRLGMVFQSYAIWPHMTVIENVAFPLRVARAMSKPQIKARALEVLAMVGLEEFAERHASLLSGGQMQRVALARSVAMNPRMMLLDEPLSNLDAKLRDRLRFELKELHDRLGMTALYVTHDLAEALALGDRVVVMNKGKIVQSGPPRQVYSAPASRFVADFLGMTNLYDGVVDAVEEAGGEAVVSVKLLETGVCVTASLSDPPAVGDEVVVCLSPEYLRLTPGRPGAATPNSWRGEITTENYLGPQTRYRVHTDGGLVLDVATGADSVFEGDSDMSVTIEPRRVQVIKAEVPQ